MTDAAACAADAVACAAALSVACTGGGGEIERYVMHEAVVVNPVMLVMLMLLHESVVVNPVMLVMLMLVGVIVMPPPSPPGHVIPLSLGFVLLY